MSTHRLKCVWGEVDIFLGPFEQEQPQDPDPGPVESVETEPLEANAPECSLCGSARHASCLQQCLDCKITVHSFCMPVERMDHAMSRPPKITQPTKGLQESNKVAASLFEWSFDKNKPRPEPPPPQEPPAWQCWRCASCESCSKSFWEAPIRRIDLHRVDDAIQEGTWRELCGLCLHRYAHPLYLFTH